MSELLERDDFRALLLEGDVVLQQLHWVRLLLHDPSLLGIRLLSHWFFFIHLL